MRISSIKAALLAAVLWPLVVFGQTKSEFNAAFNDLVNTGCGFSGASHQERVLALVFAEKLAGEFETYSGNQLYKPLCESLIYKNIDAAIRHCENLKGTLNDSTYNLLYARLSVIKTDFVSAQEYYENTCAMMENNTNVLLEASDFFRHRNMNSVALQYVHKALVACQRTPQEKMARIMAAKIYFETGEYQKTEQELNAVSNVKVKKKQDIFYEAECAYIRGKVFNVHKQYTESKKQLLLAIQNYQKKGGKDLTISRIYYLLSEICSKEDDFQTALQFIDKSYDYINKSKLTESEKQPLFAKNFLQRGLICRSMGNYTDAVEYLNKSLQCMLSASEKSLLYTVDLADIKTNLASCDLDMKDYRKAEALCDDAEALYNLPDIEKSESALSGKAFMYNIKGMLGSRQGKNVEAMNNYNLSLDIYDLLVYKFRERYLDNHALVCRNIAMLYDNMRQYDEALYFYKHAAAEEAELFGHNEVAQSRYANTLLNIGNIFRKRERTDSALTYLHRALDIYKKIQSPTLNEQADYSTVCNNLAILYRKTGNMEIAENFYNQAYQMRRNLASGNSDYQQLLADIQNNYGLFYIDNGDNDMALYYFTKAVEIRENNKDSISENSKNVLADSYDNIAYVSMLLGNFNDAENYYQKSAEIRRSLFANSPKIFANDYCTTLKNQGLMYFRSNQPQKSLKCLEKAVDIYTFQMQNDSVNRYEQIADVKYNISIIYSQMGKTDDAIKTMEDVCAVYLALQAKKPEIYNSEAAGALQLLGDFYFDKKNSNMTMVNYSNALNIYEQFVEEKPDFKINEAQIYSNIGLLKINENQNDEAIKNFLLARNIYKSLDSKQKNIETAVNAAKNNINIVNYYLQNSDNKNRQESKKLLDETIDVLSPYLDNPRAKEYYNNAQQLYKKL